MFKVTIPNKERINNPEFKDAVGGYLEEMLDGQRRIYENLVWVFNRLRKEIYPRELLSPIRRLGLSGFVENRLISAGVIYVVALVQISESQLKFFRSRRIGGKGIGRIGVAEIRDALKKYGLKLDMNRSCDEMVYLAHVYVKYSHWLRSLNQKLENLIVVHEL